MTTAREQVEAALEEHDETIHIGSPRSTSMYFCHARVPDAVEVAADVYEPVIIALLDALEDLCDILRDPERDPSFIHPMMSNADSAISRAQEVLG
jgi:hypothetical protein